MTASEWRSGDNPARMTEFLRGRVSVRNLRLLACGIVRSGPFHRDGRTIWELLPDFEWFADPDGYDAGLDARRLIEIAERRAEGQAGDREWRAAGDRARAILDQAEADTEEDDAAIGPGAHFPGSFFRLAAARAVAAAFEEEADDLALALWTYHVEDFEGDRRSMRMVARNPGPASCTLMREAFGDPFTEPMTIAPARLPADVAAMARVIANERAFDRMPDLADALEAAGVIAAELLAHLRGPGPHVRRCWMLAAVLGRG